MNRQSMLNKNKKKIDKKTKKMSFKVIFSLNEVQKESKRQKAPLTHQKIYIVKQNSR